MAGILESCSAVCGRWEERVLKNACFIAEDDGLASTCTYLTEEMTQELEEGEVKHLFKDDGNGNLVPLDDGRIPSFDKEYTTEWGDVSQAFLVCTVRGAFIYPSAAPDTGIAYCIAKLPSGESQGVFFSVDNNPDGQRDVFFVNDGVLPGSWETRTPGFEAKRRGRPRRLG